MRGGSGSADGLNFCPMGRGKRISGWGGRMCVGVEMRPFRVCSCWPQLLPAQGRWGASHPVGLLSPDQGTFSGGSGPSRPDTPQATRICGLEARGTHAHGGAGALGPGLTHPGPTLDHPVGALPSHIGEEPAAGAWCLATSWDVPQGFVARWREMGLWGCCPLENPHFS